MFTGKKKGTIANKPWTHELCHVALEYYRILARQTEIENMSGWPMLAGQGIAKGAEGIELGPNTVLFAPPSDGTGGSKWESLGPDAALVEQIGKGSERVLDVFSKLAMQPTVPKAGITATAAGVDNSRTHSAIEAWAGNLKNGLDEGLAYVADTATANSAPTLLHSPEARTKRRSSAMRKGATLSRQTQSAPNSNAAASWVRTSMRTEQRLEQQGLEPEQPMDPVSGNVLAFDQRAG